MSAARHRTELPIDSALPHLIATLGLKDLVIVHSRDATMVCKKRDAQALRELLANIEAKFGDKYL